MELPNSLKEALSDRKIIPFVGAGISRGVLGKDRTPLFLTWTELLRGAADRLRQERKDNPATLIESLVNDDDLLEAAARAQINLGTANWLKYLKSRFDKVCDDADPSSLKVPRLVWTLGSNLVITTNYDRVLQWTCPDRADFRVWDIEAKAEQVAAMRNGTVPRPTVWHLHGQIDNAAKLILTPSNYATLYGAEQPPEFAAALDTLRTVLKSHSFLFLGFSMSDVDFMKQVAEVTGTYGGASGQHFALLHKGVGDAKALRALGVEPIFYDKHDEIENWLQAMSIQALQAMPTSVRTSRYIVDRNEGLYLFGGRGDAFFDLYDDSLVGMQDELDIFSLKLSRFRRQHTDTLLAAAPRTRIRIALLDPAFPMPEDHASLAAIREQEERSPVGAIRRDVAEWAKLIADYRAAVQNGKLIIPSGKGLSVRLYNILPTVNLFRVDSSLFVGPYLLDVEDRETPTFLVKSSAPGHGSMGSSMFAVYQKHFNAVWENSRTRNLEDVPETELESWRQGRGCASA